MAGVSLKKSTNALAYSHQRRTAQTIQDAIRRFEADYPNVKIEEVTPSMTSTRQLMIAMGANDEPDIFMSWGGGPIETYINAGKVWA